MGYHVQETDRNGTPFFQLVQDGFGTAEIYPQFGQNAFSFVTGEDRMEHLPFETFLSKPTSYGNPILFPFPNRIRDGVFTFNGETFTVTPKQHGFVRDKKWDVIGSGASDADGAWVTATCDASDHPEAILGQFPFPFRITVTYRLRDGRLAMETEIENTGSRAMPAGFGIHPYFQKPANGSITVPAAQRWELVENLPTGQKLDLDATFDLRNGRSLDGLVLDDIYTALEPDADGLVRCLLTDFDKKTETVVEFSAAEFPHVVVYTTPAPRTAICIEPNTCPTDAFNLEARGIPADMLVLEPGQKQNFLIVFTTRNL